MDVVQAALQNVFDWQVLAIIVGAAAYGLCVGAIPGLTATMAVALMVPMTFFMSDVQAVAAIVTTVTCTIFAGDIPATLVRIPGTPASAAYASDAYALTQQGRHIEAMLVSLVFSVAGGLFGVLVLSLAAPSLARVATKFTSYEYFWLYLLGLTCAAVVSGDSRLRGAVALLIGMLLSTVGLGTDYSLPRLTFGFDQLIQGVSFIPAMIGLFGISEVLSSVTSGKVTNTGQLLNNATLGDQRVSTGLLAVLSKLRQRKFALFRSSAVGSAIGMLPGAGADIAAWISYAISKQFSNQPEEYGRGSVDGLSDATGANNAALGSAWIPALVFGIPGDSVTAIAIGVLLMKNITPGPDIFNATENPTQAALVYAVFITFVLANIVLLPLGLLATKVGAQLIRIPGSILMPLIVMFCIVGSFALNASYFDVGLMLVMGVFGFVLERLSIPLGPVVLGIILGGELEHRFVQCAMKSTDAASFFQSPISIALALVVVLLWLSPMLKRSLPRWK